MSNDSEEDLLGGLDIETSAEIDVPDNLIDQVIGQEDAVDRIKKAAKNGRHVMMIGSPGTGKSMLGKAMADMMPQENTEDILMYPNPDDDKNPQVRTVPGGKGEEIIESEKEEQNKRESLKSALIWILVIGIVSYGFLSSQLLLGVLAAGVVFIAFKYISGDADDYLPNMIVDSSDNDTAPFNDATGAHSGALLGDVEHDPFQSGGMGTPAHQRVKPGMIHKSNKGVLFVDEINTMEVKDQQKLMTAIQEGELSITGQSERSSGAMVKTDPVPCDFLLVAAGNRDALENMHPALRDRIKSYGYEVKMDDRTEDTPENRRKFARFVAQEVEKSEGNIPHFKRGAIEEVIMEARRRSNRKDSLTLKLRDLGGLVRVAGDIANSEDAHYVDREHVMKAKDKSRSIEQQMTDSFIERKQEYGVATNDGGSVGKVNGLAVMGDDSGVLLPVMAEVTEAQGRGEVIATGRLQEIAEESVDNVIAIIKKFTGESIKDKDVHIQFVQTHEGVDGDSASVTIATAIISAIKDVEVNQSVAMTGSLSVRGDVLPVGGVTHKVEAAAKAGMDKVIIPKANEDDLVLEEEYKDMVEVIPVSNISEVLNESLVGYEEGNADKIVQKLRDLTNNTKNSINKDSNPSPN
jgi:Lon-like ATP-dependent protease